MSKKKTEKNNRNKSDLPFSDYPPIEFIKEKQKGWEEIVELHKKIGRPSPKELGVTPYPYPEILDKNPLWEYQYRIATYFCENKKIPIVRIPEDHKPTFEMAALYFGYEVDQLNNEQKAVIKEAMETFEELQNWIIKSSERELLKHREETIDTLNNKKIGLFVCLGIFGGIMGFKLITEMHKVELEVIERLLPSQVEFLKFIHTIRKQIIEQLRRLDKATKRTFALPSHSIMFSLLALFSGKPERIPRTLLGKPEKEMNPQEKDKAHKLINSILEKGPPEIEFDEQSKLVEKPGPTYALICDNPKVKAKAKVDQNLLLFDDNIEEEKRLALYIKRSFGVEGLRHLLGIMIALDDQGRTGEIIWDVNKHLELLGYKKKKRAFRKRDKETALEILKIFTGLNITSLEDKGKKKTLCWDKLLIVTGGEGELKGENQQVEFSRIKIAATEFWYRNAFEPTEGKSPQFTKLLRKIVTENHRERPLTIYLAPLLAIFWRMSPERKLSVKSLMDWCDLDYTGKNRTDRLKDLEAELAYMKEKGYLGEWESNGEKALPSNCQEPFECILTLYRPEWLDKEVRAIEGKREKYLPKPKKAISGPILTREEFKQILEKSGLSQKQFALKLGKSREHISRIKKGTRKITKEISDKIREVFGEFIEKKPN